MSENAFPGLPPSKRFRLLPQQEPRAPPGVRRGGCLPAKKRIEGHLGGANPWREQDEPHLPPTSCCLPAKKRVWAPRPFLATEEYGDGEEEGSPAAGEGDLPAKQTEAAGGADTRREAAVGEEEEEEEADGIVCDICQSTDGDPLDPIVLCDGCDLMVHASCYGNPLLTAVPDGDWFCARCEHKGASAAGAPGCCLCPRKGGATKPTTDGRWGHVLCALLVPEAFFHDPEGRDGLDLSRVPARRWEGVCCLCRRAGSGCVVDCSEPRCGLALHVSCGLEADACVEYREGKAGGIVVAFCQAHTLLWKKQQTTGKFKFVPRERKRGSP